MNYTNLFEKTIIYLKIGNNEKLISAIRNDYIDKSDEIYYITIDGNMCETKGKL